MCISNQPEGVWSIYTTFNIANGIDIMDLVLTNNYRRDHPEAVVKFAAFMTKARNLMKVHIQFKHRIGRAYCQMLSQSFACEGERTNFQNEYGFFESRWGAEITQGGRPVDYLLYTQNVMDLFPAHLLSHDSIANAKALQLLQLRAMEKFNRDVYKYLMTTGSIPPLIPRGEIRKSLKKAGRLYQTRVIDIYYM